jgi:DNA-3-methyladenine glycosylase II
MLDLQKAADHLASHDPVLAPIIKSAGLPTFSPHQNYYWELVDSIISQQLSVKAAASIEKRFQALFDNLTPPPEAILQKDDEALRAVGLSRPKVKYIKDLAQHVIDGKLKFETFDSQSNQQIIAELVCVKGIGEWTAHMFLIFCMGRLDVLPVGDLGIKNGIRKLYELDDVPTPEQIQLIADKYHWQPYESVAAWYIWHSLDNKPAD